MLDPWIIEEIRRREREEQEGERLPLELPLYREPAMDPEASPPADADRGVVIIDL